MKWFLLRQRISWKFRIKYKRRQPLLQSIACFLGFHDWGYQDRSYAGYFIDICKRCPKARIQK